MKTDKIDDDGMDDYRAIVAEQEVLQAKADLLDVFIRDAREIADEPGFIHSKIVKRVTVLAEKYMEIT
jgi:hypothetical protein